MQLFLRVAIAIGAAAVAASKGLPKHLLMMAEEGGGGGGVANVFVQFPPLDWSSGGLADLQERQFQTMGDIQDAGLAWRRVRRMAVARMLQDHARASQAAVIETLRDAGHVYRSFWINNSLYVEGAPMHLLLLLANLQGVTLQANDVVARIPPLWQLLQSTSNDAGRSEVPWNIRQIRADQVGADEMRRGEGVVIASIDTGVAWEHPLLRGQYRAVREAKSTTTINHEHSWYDPRGVTSEPNDHHGHGTHTLGSAVGIGVGVAPGATWIAARGCSTQGCLRHDLIASAQWVMCPGMKEERCDLGADIVTNSWGADPGEGGDPDESVWFEPIAEAWVAAGMIPVFAIGNAGPACRTAGSPGDLPMVIGVGAVTRDRALAHFSSRGPGRAHNDGLGNDNDDASDGGGGGGGGDETTLLYKPDLVAPGHEILSCYHQGHGLVAMSGTSMATPHVAGVVALMVAANPALDQRSAQEALSRSAERASLAEPVFGQLACSQRRWNRFPNHQYGHGLVDAVEAVRKAKEHLLLTFVY